MLPAIGYALRDDNRPYATDELWTGVEIDFQRAFHPLRIAPYLHGLSFNYISLHALEISVASPEPPRPTFLEALVDVADENGAVAITDHLGFTHAQEGGAGVGHVTAPPCTEVALDTVCRNVEIIQRRLGNKSFYLENLAHFFVLHGTLDEPTFFRRMLERTGAGLLLDVTNSYANERNFGASAQEFIEAVVPAANRIQFHLAGGYFDRRWNRYVDSHAQAIPTEVWQLFDDALRLAGDKVDAIFIERDWNFPAEAAWRSELERARHSVQQQETASCTR